MLKMSNDLWIRKICYRHESIRVDASLEQALAFGYVKCENTNE